MTTESPDYDSPWKDIIESFFPEFVSFYFPQTRYEIDWEKGYEFLDYDNV